MYNDQIFVLLGHNGAGKTTTISMVTNKIYANSGLITWNGLNLKEDAAKMYGKIGICP
jgi:ATP-binding cassette subfamily A (ABC1) protein 3